MRNTRTGVWQLHVDAVRFDKPKEEEQEEEEESPPPPPADEEAPRCMPKLPGGPRGCGSL